MLGNQRKIKNFMINPAFQLKMMSYFAVSGLALVGVVVYAAYFRITALANSLDTSSYLGIRIKAYLDEAMTDILVAAAIAFLIFLVVQGIYAIVISHRIAGPQIPIKRLVNELKEGHYGAHNQIRKYDEFQELMTNLNELSEILKTKHGS